MWRISSRLGLLRRLSTNHAQRALFSSSGKNYRIDTRNSVVYLISLVFVFLGLSFASAPLYKTFCSMTGFGGTVQIVEKSKIEKMVPLRDKKPIRIDFIASTHDTLPWSFKPAQPCIYVVPGESCLAFFTTKNLSDRPINGVATYSVSPPTAGKYFNKIQCFCFEEQRLKPGEEVDMPVLFFVDPDIASDRSLADIREILLSYTFFNSQEENEESVGTAWSGARARLDAEKPKPDLLFDPAVSATIDTPVIKPKI